MVWLVTERAEVVKVAWAEPLRVTLLARVAAPSRKLTVPLGVPDPGALAATVAVKVTVCPKTDGLLVEVTVVVLGSVVRSAGEAESVPELARKFVSPE